VIRRLDREPFTNPNHTPEDQPQPHGPPPQNPLSLPPQTLFSCPPRFEGVAQSRAPPGSRVARFVTRHPHSTAPAMAQRKNAFSTRDARLVSPDIENRARISCRRR